MSIEKERVQPAPFDTAAPTGKPAETQDASAPGLPRWVLPALGGLVLLVLGVVFWLPAALEPGESDPGSAPTAPQTVASTERAPNPPGAAAPQSPAAGTPFADAEAARLRSEAQEILEDLLDLRDSLASRAADIWAGDALAAVNAAASEGDELYRQREFEAAIARYRSALGRAQAIESRIPDELESRLQATEDALQAGDADAARPELAIVDRLEPGLEQAESLGRRLDALPDVLAQLKTAAAAEKADDLETAKTALEAAVAADGQHRRAREALQRVSAALTARRFTDAMSAGFAALEDQRFDDARAAFGRAGRLREGSAEVATALQEVSVAETASELRQLQREAQASVEQETWSAAVAAYEAALDIDSSVMFAQRGLEQALLRAELDSRLQAILDDPDRLSDKTVAGDAGDLLEYATGVEPRGTVLQDQIRTLQKLMALSNTPVRVILLSDNLTEVTLYKVSRLGQFEREELMLRPGEYTAVGTRRGFRDVRRTFRVSHEGRPPKVTVVCTERI